MQLNSLADCVPCAAHSLHLVGVARVNCSLESVNFLAIVQELYVFAVLIVGIGLLLVYLQVRTVAIMSLKTLSNTRWRCRAESVKALRVNYAEYYLFSV